jgi:hypothetical protein
MPGTSESQAMAALNAAYDTTYSALKVISGLPQVSLLFKYSGNTAVTSGDVITWVPATSQYAKVLLVVGGIIGGADDALIAVQENTGTIGSPTWTTRIPIPCKASSAVNFAFALPERRWGPAGNGSGATVKVTIVSGTTPKVWATLHGYEEA